MNRFGPRHGVTLLELMVVLIVLVLLAGAVLPQFAGTYHDALLGAAGRRLLGAIQLAHSQSVTSSRPLRLHLDGASHRYRIEVLDGAAGSSRYVPLTGVRGSEGEIDRRIRLDLRPLDSEPGMPWERGPREADRIAFYPDGTADGSRLVLRDEEGYGVALEIQPTTARVKVVELAQEEVR